MWHAGRGPTPGMTNIFPGPKKICSKTFLIGWIPYVQFSEILKKSSGGWWSWRQSQAQGQWSHKAMTCACGMYVHCTFTVGTCRICPAVSEKSRNIPIFEIKECNIVRTHSCDSKEAKMRSRHAFSDSNQQNPIFKYHRRPGFTARLTITCLNHSVHLQ